MWKIVFASASRTGRARSRSAAVAADHERQLPLSARRDAARDRRVEDAGAGRPRVALRGHGSSRRHGRQVDEDGAGPGAREQPVRPAVDRLDGLAVGEHRDADVGRGGHLGRRARPRARRARAASARPRRGVRLQRRRRTRPRPGREPSPSPSGPIPSDADRRSPAHFAVVEPSLDGRRRSGRPIGIARSSSAAADGSGMCGVVIRTIGASRL